MPRSAAKKQPIPSPTVAERSKPSTPKIDPRYTVFRLSLRGSRIHRWGVFAEEFIPKGRKVIEYTGERCNRRETAKRADGPLNYMFTLNSYWALDGSVMGSGAEFVNHSCDPNCEARIVKGHILYMAARDIPVGQELTIDYHFDSEVDPVKCACGTAKCRGTINLKREPKTRAKSSPKSSPKSAPQSAKTPAKRAAR
jgi:hypothetical protein